MDAKIIEFINQLDKEHPLSELIQVREKLNNDSMYIDILELSLAYLITNKQ
jgi:hypothetical protein